MTAPGDPPPPRPRGALRWCFEDRGSGRIVIAQWPNLPMWIAIVGFAVHWLHPAGRLGTAVLLVGVFGLAWWAVDELVRGVNPWRRLLGALGLAYVVYRLWPLLGI